MITRISVLALGLMVMSCSNKIIQFSNTQLRPVNRLVTSVDPETNTINLNNQRGSGMAIVEGVEFSEGVIEIDFKGENVPGKSFVGLAFNVQNDSTYEAVYFRPFNFQSPEKIRREHSVQYIFHPKNTWKYLRTNFEGQYEAEYPRRPSPDDWFKVRIKIDERNVLVTDVKSNQKLLTVERLSKQKADKIALWTGHNSKGAFRDIKIVE